MSPLRLAGAAPIRSCALGPFRSAPPPARGRPDSRLTARVSPSAPPDAMAHPSGWPRV